MISFAPRRPSPITLALAMGFAVLVTASSASASCGDYLHTGETMRSDAMPTETLPSDGSAPTCTGPHCSRGSMTLASPVSRTERTLSDIVISPAEQWPSEDLVISAARYPDRTDKLSVGSPDSLFRPPIA